MKKVNVKLIIELAVGVLMVGVLSVGLIYFGALISDNVKEIQAVKQDLTSRAATLFSFATLRSQYNAKGKAYLSVLDNTVPAYDQLFDVSKEIKALASKNNLGFGFKFFGDKPPTETAPGSIGFEANVSGDLNQMFKFVQDLENLRFLSSLTGFDFSRQGGIFQAVVRGQIYYR